MLDRLPVEVLHQIIGELPTASAVINLSVANKQLHTKVASNNYEIFRNFVQNRFPSIATPALWRDAARLLTTRSRAWDRRAFLGRACAPPRDTRYMSEPFPMQKIGYVPIIDSYESWEGGRWADKREVLVWGVYGKLVTRVVRNGAPTWTVWRTAGDQLPQNDILDLRLLSPHQKSSKSGETAIVRRANRDVVKVEILEQTQCVTQVTKYETDPDRVDCVDVNRAASPLLAACNAKSIHLFEASQSTSITKPSSILALGRTFNVKHRKRCAKFLSDTTLALGVQFLEGRLSAPIEIYHVTPSGLFPAPDSAYPAGTNHFRRSCANAIAPLDATASLIGRAGEVFLSGWSDGIVRLHDLRAPEVSVTDYVDTVDDGQVLSLLPIGHERLLAGSHHNGCLKIFDLRMGAKAYSYTGATAGREPLHHATSHANSASGYTNGYRSWTEASAPVLQREINIFLTFHLPRPGISWRGLPRRQDVQLPRYGGSVYSLSSPSPCSPTVYAGIENSVIQIESLSTDDIVEHNDLLCLGSISSKGNPKDILNLSCYERPRPGYQSTDPVLLRKQIEWPEVAQQKDVLEIFRTHQSGIKESGWDMRWRLAVSDRPRRGSRTVRPVAPSY